MNNQIELKDPKTNPILVISKEEVPAYLKEYGALDEEVLDKILWDQFQCALVIKGYVKPNKNVKYGAK